MHFVASFLMFSWVFKTYGNLGSFCGSDLKSGLCCLILDFEIIFMVTPKVELNSVKYISFSHDQRLENNKGHWQITTDVNDSFANRISIKQIFLVNYYIWLGF